MLMKQLDSTYFFEIFFVSVIDWEIALNQKNAKENKKNWPSGFHSK